MTDEAETFLYLALAAIARLNAAGDTTMMLWRDMPAQPVTDEDLEAWRDGQAAIFERAPGVQSDIEELIPASKPVLTALFADDEGRLWVGRTVPPDDAPLFDVFDAEGSFISSVRLFPGTSSPPSPVVRGRRVYAVLGELDEGYVVAAPLPAVFQGR